MEEKFCKFCGKKIPFEAVVCTHCGKQVEELKVKQEQGMNWFNFVGKYLLIILPILNAIIRINSFIKYMSSYQPFQNDLFYFGLLIIETILWVALPIFIYIKFRQKNKYFPSLIIIWELLVTEYLITCNVIFSTDVLSINSSEFTSFISKILGTILGAGINIYYFYKRLDVFNKSKEIEKSKDVGEAK